MVAVAEKQQQVFDPRVHLSEEEETSAVPVVWTTQSIEWAFDAIKFGKPYSRSPFHEKNPDLRKGNLVYHYSDWELAEMVKCSRNIMYFIENYCSIKRPDGKIGKIKLRSYQLKQIKDYIENDEIILGWSRQSGKTIGTALYILWCMIFNADKHTAILANKGATSKEVLDKVKGIYKFLPFWLKPGILGWNNGVMAFDNGCRVYTGPTTNDALNGKTCNILYIDEMAFVGKGSNKIEYQRDFLANAKPVLSSQKQSGLCKLIISSTPFGKEYFYELFDNAMKKKNRLKASKVCWWEIPGKDVQWAKDEISSIGISKFKQQYEMSFDVHAESLLKVRTMRRLSRQKTKYLGGNFDILSNYEEYLFMHPDVEIDTNLDVFCLSVDLAEGLAQDYSVIQILRLGFDAELSRHIYEQIGVFACNTIPLEDFALVTRELFNAWNPEYSKLLVEQNTYGDYFFKCLQDDQVSNIEVPFESICKFKRSSDATSKIKGLRTNREVKKIAVKSFKSLIDDEFLLIHEEETIAEIENFQKNSKDLYEATVGHDDKVTPLVNFSYWAQLNENEFKYWIEEFSELNGIQQQYGANLDDGDVDISSLSAEVQEFL